MKTCYTITPRPKERDVLLQCEGAPTLLVVRQEGLSMEELTSEARRIAALLDGREARVLAAARIAVHDAEDTIRRAASPGGQHAGPPRMPHATAITIRRYLKREVDALDGGGR